MRRPLEPGEPASAIVADEVAMLAKVQTFLAALGGPAEGEPAADYDQQLIALRDQISDEKLEDLPSLVEQMTRVSAIASGRRGKSAIPVDAQSPYFAHMRLQSGDSSRPSDVLIGRRGLIDRQAGVQIVDWRDAPVSQVYYRYEEGDDYEEELPGGTLKGVVLARRNVTVAAGLLRRIGCLQGTFVGSIDGRWFALSGQGVALLEGGAGTAARAPDPQRQPHKKGQRFETARAAHSENKQLPEIAALIDRAQFDLITEQSRGLVVIQGGAGSGKTTVALHRVAYLLFNDRSLKPSRCLVLVPSDALMRYVSGVLPALGVQGVPVTTVRSWMRNLRRRLVQSAPDIYTDETPPSVSRLKKHPALIGLLELAVEDELAAARKVLATRAQDHAETVLAAWDKRTAPPADHVRALRSAVEGGKLPLPPQIAHPVADALKKIGKQLRDVRQIVSQLLTNRERLEGLRAPGVLEPAQVREIEELVRWSSTQLEEARPSEWEGIDEERLQPIDGRALGEDDGATEEAARGKLDHEDDALLLRMYQLIHGGFVRVDGEPLAYDHIAVDEAQDLCALDVKVIHDSLTGRRSLTIAGDVAQRVIFDNAFRGWAELLADAGIAGGQVTEPLRLAYRSTAPVMRFAREVLGPLADPNAEIAARDGAEVSLHTFAGMGEAVGFVAEALRSLLGREPSASVALITRHPGQADAWHSALQRAEVPMLRRVRRQDFAFVPGIDVTDIGQVKGLEFDYVLLLDVNQSSYAGTVESRHLLHIGATRATHQLWLVATGVVSELVSGAETVQRMEEASAG